MPTTELEDLPRRLVLEVPLPERLSDEAITQTCDLVSARLRYLMSQEFQRRGTVRLQQRLQRRADQRRARLDAAIREAEAAEAADAKATARQAGFS